MCSPKSSFASRTDGTVVNFKDYALRKTALLCIFKLVTQNSLMEGALQRGVSGTETLKPYFQLFSASFLGWVGGGGGDD